MKFLENLIIANIVVGGIILFIYLVISFVLWDWGTLSMLTWRMVRVFELICVAFAVGVSLNDDENMNYDRF